MTHERDPLDDLRAAWQRLQPPTRGEDIGEQDDLTRDAVSWMQAAWSRVEPATPAVPPATVRPAHHRRPILIPMPALRPLAAAAVLLVLLGGPYLLGPPGETPAPTPGPEPRRAAPTLAAADGHLELRSGPVRLLLLGPEEERPN